MTTTRTESEVSQPVLWRHRDDRQSPNSDILEKLLRKGREYSFEFIRMNPEGTVDPDICNHLELSLISAIELGASDRDLRRFYDDYVPRWPLEKLPVVRRPIDHSNWHVQLGDRRYEVEYRLFFKGEVARLGWQEAVRYYTPTFIDGPAGSAFHSMIRLAYAVIRRDPVEVAEGLAYWATVKMGFPRSSEAEPFTSRPAEVLKRIRESPQFRELNHSGIGLWARMNLMGHEPEFAPVVHWLEVHENTLQLIAHDSLALFIETNDMRALHAITASQALRELLPFLNAEDRVRAIRYLWQAICAVYGLMGFITPTPDERLEELRHTKCPPWDDIKAAARTSLDEHDLKVVFVMSEEELAYGDPLYQVASARRMKLI